jgi:hypothetical protein
LQIARVIWNDWVTVVGLQKAAFHCPTKSKSYTRDCHPDGQGKNNEVYDMCVFDTAADNNKQAAISKIKAVATEESHGERFFFLDAALKNFIFSA